MAEKHVRYSVKIAGKILPVCPMGGSLRSICREEAMPGARVCAPLG